MNLEYILGLKGYRLVEIIREEEVINTICEDKVGKRCIVDIQNLQFRNGYLGFDIITYYFEEHTNLYKITVDDCMKNVISYKEDTFYAGDI